jgi:hypothetical protein
MAADPIFNKAPPNSSEGRIIVFLASGAFVFFLAWLGNIVVMFCASFVLGTLTLIAEAVAAGAHAWGERYLLPYLLPLVVAPAVEEGLRAWVMIQLANSPGKARKDQYRWPVAAFGLGFGLAEAAPRWFVATQQGSEYLSIFGPVLPLVMHIALTIAIALFVIGRKPILGFALCAMFHVVHNCLAFLVFDTNPIFTSALPFLIGAYSLVAAALLVWWSSRAPKLQFRTEFV